LTAWLEGGRGLVNEYYDSLLNFVHRLWQLNSRAIAKVTRKSIAFKMFAALRVFLGCFFPVFITCAINPGGDIAIKSVLHFHHPLTKKE
jgi:hypothetical protein